MAKLKRIKIIFVINSLSGGGAERVFANLLNSFNRDKFECKLLLIGNLKKDSYTIPDDINIISLNKSKKRALISLLKILLEEEPEIVFSNLAPINILALVSKLIIRNHKTKYIIRETTFKSISIEKTKDNILTRFIYKSLIKILYNYADGIVSLSEGTKNDLIKSFGVNEAKIKVIYNPIDIIEIDKRKNEIVTDIEIRKNIINLILVGSLVKSKGHRYLIQAVYKLKEHYGYSLKTYFIGTGNLEKQLRDLVLQYNLKEDISFLGFKSNPFKYMVNCDIFILPAIWEGFGNVIVEAMACRIPVISTNCPSGPREIIINNVNGILVEAENTDSLVQAIKNLIDNPEMYNKIRENGYKRSKDFELNKITLEYEDYFLDVLKN